jgi:hypothetical protein
MDAEAYAESPAIIMRTSPKTLLVAFAVVAFVVTTARSQTYQYMLEPGSTITPSYYGSPVGPTEPLSGTFSWTFVQYSATWSTVNFATTALDFHSPSFSLTLAGHPVNGGTGTAGPWAGFEADVTAKGAPLASALHFVPWPANDGTFEGDPFMPSRLIFLHERLDPAVGALVSFTAVLVPEPAAAGLVVLGLVAMAGWKRPRPAATRTDRSCSVTRAPSR